MSNHFDRTVDKLTNTATSLGAAAISTVFNTDTSLEFFDPHFHVWDVSDQSNSGHDASILFAPNGMVKLLPAHMVKLLPAHMPYLGLS